MEGRGGRPPRQRTYCLDLADEIQRRRQGLLTRRPLGWANLTWVSSDVLSSLHLAQQFLGVAADTEIIDLSDLDHAFRIHNERATQRETFFFDQHAEVAADRMGRI